MPSLISNQSQQYGSQSEEEADSDQAAVSLEAFASNKRARLNLNGDASPRRTPISHGYSGHSSSTLLQESLQARPSTKAYQPGSIVRVKLVNFVTYDLVEFFPGPSLNMVIGPNGTGKSTLVCAICLGLGWGPQHLGRAKEVSEFVKHGFQEAVIEIELAGDKKRTKGRNLVITCKIKREGNKTSFSVNGKPSTKKAVVEYAKSFSIQIDNLCQFLPQDKVVEFAAMTPVELLKSTQRAVGSQEMIDMHENLKELGQKHKEIQARQASDQDTLGNLEGRQRMQEADVERMRERESIKERVRLMEAARPFARYREARLRHKEAKEKRKEHASALKKLEEEVEPSLRAVNEKQRYQQQIDIVVKERRQAIENADRSANALDKEVGALAQRGEEFVKERDTNINNGRADKKEIARLEGNVSRIKKQMGEEPPSLDISSCNEQIREQERAAEGFRQKVLDLQKGQVETTRRGKERSERIREAEQELANLESQAGQQNKKLFKISRDTAKLWEWVQTNQEVFEKPVFGPPVVECSITDPRFVDMIETVFQKNMFLSFTVQSNNDFKKLQAQAHDRMGLSEVNIKVMSSGLEAFPPPIGPDELKHYGFQGWAIDYIQGPEPVLAMICYDLRLHRTAVAIKDTTTQQYEQLQNSPIDSWLTSKSSYNIVRRREYGPDATSTRVREVRRATVWTDQPVDLAAKRELQENIHAWGEELKSFGEKNSEAQDEIVRLRDNIREKNQEIKNMQDDKALKQKALSEFRALPTKLAQQEGKLAECEKSIETMRERLQAIEDRHDALTLERGQVTLQYADAVENLREQHQTLHESEIMLIEATSDLTLLIERNSSVNDMLETKRAELQTVIRETEAVSTEARRLLQVCTKLMETNDRSLHDFFSTMPEGQTIEELELEIESERNKLELLHEGNGGVIREFEERQKKIDALKANLEDIRHGLAELDEKIQEIRGQWEPELDGLVKKISDSFSLNMKQINCAGEVGVFKDEDFDQWAIQIRVKFRESEPLTILDSHRQSGGERAVSTIFYLMSLQTLTRSPFRVVDEINQGMDPRNERLVHKRMVGIACGVDETSGGRGEREGAEEDAREDGQGQGQGHAKGGEGEGGSQYFLITPKLLHGLEYARGMQVMCIAAGEYMPEERSRVDFRGCVDLARGLKGMGMGMGIGGAGVGAGVGAGAGPGPGPGGGGVRAGVGGGRGGGRRAAAVNVEA